MRLPILLAGLIVSASALPAAATGTLECEIKDKSVSFSLHAGMTRGMGSPTFSLKGEMEVRDKGVAPDLRTIGFANEDRPQYWMNSKELRMVLYTERNTDRPFASVELELLTKAAGDDGSYGGSYKLTIHDMSTGGGEGKTTTLRGKVGCSVD